MNATRPMRVAIVDDYEVVIEGLARMLAPFSDRVEIVELAANTPVSQPVDIALYDTFAQAQGGDLDIPSALEEYNAARLVIYSWTPDPTLVANSLAPGAHGYVPKRVTAEELVSALEAINAGERVVMGEDADAEPEPGDWPGRSQGLSEREAEVIALITQGFSNDQIAGRVFLSINTVKSYIRSA